MKTIALRFCFDGVLLKFESPMFHKDVEEARTSLQKRENPTVSDLEPRRDRSKPYSDGSVPGSRRDLTFLRFLKGRLGRRVTLETYETVKE